MEGILFIKLIPNMFFQILQIRSRVRHDFHLQRHVSLMLVLTCPSRQCPRTGENSICSTECNFQRTRVFQGSSDVVETQLVQLNQMFHFSQLAKKPSSFL